MCNDCSICGKNRKLKESESIKRGYVTFSGKAHWSANVSFVSERHDKLVPVYPLAECHVCGCTWISDVGGFGPEWEKQYITATDTARHKVVE